MAHNGPSSRVVAHASGVLRSKLVGDLPALPRAQKRLAIYLLENVATASDLGITDLAEEAGVSTGTIALLCRRLGLRGYQDLRLAWAREAVTVASVGGGKILALQSAEDAEPDSTKFAILRVFGANTEALVETAQHLDEGALDLAAAWLASAHRVEWVGAGTASLVAAEGALKLRKLGIDAVAHAGSHQQSMSAAVLNETDVLVAVSHSGRTADVLRCVQLGREAGAQIVAITGAGHSPIESLADIVLATVSYDTAFQVEPMASTIVELSVVQLLFLLLLERGGPRAHEQLARTQAAVEPQRTNGRHR
jgi:RpiR family carbohydrate utilization transcriptional regulator